MAEGVQISVSEEKAANDWLGNVMLINEDYHQAMQEAGETLVDMQNFADGTMVDELVNLGSTMLDAAKKTFDAINTIADTVKQALGLLGGFVEGAKEAIKGVFDIFG